MSTRLKTKIPAVMDAIKAAIVAAPPTGVKAAPSLGYPAGGLADEHVWISGESRARMINRVSGLQQRDEVIPVEIHCRVMQYAADYIKPRDRAFAIAGEVEEAVLADVTLGGVANLVTVVEVYTEEAIPGERQREVAVTISLEVGCTVVAS